MQVLKNKTGYIFTLDALLAVLILTISISVLFSTIPSSPPDYFIDHLASDTINTLAFTKTTDLCTLEPCNCPRYASVEVVVCNNLVRNKDASLLEVFSEVLLTGVLPQENLQDIVHEMFVTSNVIDPKRFGISLIYNAPGLTQPVELYNSEVYT